MRRRAPPFLGAALPDFATLKNVVPPALRSDGPVVCKVLLSAPTQARAARAGAGIAARTRFCHTSRNKLPREARQQLRPALIILNDLPEVLMFRTVYIYKDNYKTL